jgi:hypothetical protein
LHNSSNTYILSFTLTCLVIPVCNLCAVLQRNEAIENRKDLTEEGKKEQKDLAAEGFLELLLHYRVVFLQDAACLQDEFGAMRTFQHRVFRHPSWTAFKEQVLAAHSTVDNLLHDEEGVSEEVALAILELQQQQSTGVAAMQAKLDALTSANQELKELLKARTERSGIGLEDAIQMLQVLQGLGGSSRSELHADVVQRHHGGTPTTQPTSDAVPSVHVGASAAEEVPLASKSGKKKKPVGLGVVRAAADPPPIIELEKDLHTWWLKDVWSEFVQGRGQNAPLASYIWKWRSAWRQNIIHRARWGERSMLHFLIIETGKALDVPNDTAASLWVEVASSLSLYLWRKRVNRWNIEVRAEKNMAKRDPKKDQPAFGLRYIAELALLLQVDVCTLQRGGRVAAQEISDVDECIEWPMCVAIP